MNIQTDVKQRIYYGQAGAIEVGCRPMSGEISDDLRGQLLLDTWPNELNGQIEEACRLAFRSHNNEQAT